MSKESAEYTTECKPFCPVVRRGRYSGTPCTCTYTYTVIPLRQSLSIYIKCTVYHTIQARAMFMEVYGFLTKTNDSCPILDAFSKKTRKQPSVEGYIKQSYWTRKRKYCSVRYSVFRYQQKWEKDTYSLEIAHWTRKKNQKCKREKKVVNPKLIWIKIFRCFLGSCFTSISPRPPLWSR